AASSSYRNINGTGWIPLNLTNLSIQAPIATLPVDPLNTSSTNCYSYETDGTNWEVGGAPESQKYISSQASSSFVNGSTLNFFTSGYCGPLAYTSTTYAGIMSNAYSIAFDSHTDTMWVANYGKNSVTVFNDTTMASTTYPTGPFPDAVGFDPHTNTVWVASVTGNSVTVFNDTNFATSTYA